MARTETNLQQDDSIIPGITQKDEGVYNFVDESGNLTEIKKKLLERDKYYADALSKTDQIIGEVYVIGVNSVDPMGCGDDTAAYAIY